MKRRRRKSHFNPSVMCGKYEPTFRSTELLEERTLLTNLALAEAFLITGVGERQANPILGGQIEVRTSFSTTNLAADATYAIRVSIDGVFVDHQDLTFGAGSSSATWQRDYLHGFAESGSKMVTVTLDPLNQIVEDNETDNTITFTYIATQATNLPQKLAWVVDGSAGTDWRIINFADLDPRPGILRDYRGGEFSYDLESDGHNAIDIAPGAFADMDQGIPVLAAADGVVVAVNDGEFDRQSSFLGSAVANSVIVDHGNGWKTLYWHLRRDSVAVRIGDIVQAGDAVGLVGSSGFSTGAHVHIELRYNDHAVETMLDPTTYWITPPAYPADYRHVIQSGFSSRQPTASEFTEEPESMTTFQRGNRVYFWILAGAMMPNDVRKVQFLRPDGSTYYEQSDNQGSAFYKASQWYYFITLPGNAPLGTWTAVWFQNDVELTRKSFTVASTGVPELRVEVGSDYLRHDRFTPVDFGTVSVNAASSARVLTITNQGTSPLTVGTISLPSGFVLDSLPASSVPAGGTTTVTIRLNTSIAGYFGGELRLPTNDPDEPEFRLWLEGTVEAAGTPTLIPGLSVRRSSEGTQLIANVRRTGSTTSAVTVQLQVSDSSEIAVPSTVTIPAGAKFASFFVQSLQDFTEDGLQRAALTVSATGYSTGRNELTVLNTPSSLPSLNFATTAMLNQNTTFSWSSVAGGVDYELWVNFTTGNVSKVVHQTVTGTSLTLPGFSEMGSYRVWVRARGISGLTSAWSQPRDLQVTTTSQLNSVPPYVGTSQPTFSWPAVPTAIRYEIWLNDVTQNLSKVVHNTNVATTSFTVPQALPMSQYRVWIRGIDALGQVSIWSAAREFYVAPWPQTDLTAVATFDRTPTLSWNPVLGAATYEVWVRNMWTNTDSHRVSGIQSSHWTVPTNLTDGRYVWWVRAHSSNGLAGLWSYGRELFVGGRPTVLPPTVSPAKIPTFQWQAVEGATVFQLQVDRIDVPTSRVYRQDTLTGTSWSPGSSLSTGQYRVWMRSVSSSGEFSLWSAAIDFIV